MHLHQKFLSSTTLLLLLLVSSCSRTPAATPTELPQPTAAPTVEIEPTLEPTIDFEGDLADFDITQFDDSSATIDNEWFPLPAGLQNTLEGSAEEAGRTIPHQIIFTVTDLTKEIYGIQTIVVWVQDYSADELVEAELAFYAQDMSGNVWHMGEYPEVYENGELVEAPAWISGYKGAKPGISMKAELQLGLPSYSQGWGPAVNWTDRAQVAEMGLEVCVQFDCYEGVLLIEEFSKEEPNAFQLKYYARGIGNMKVGWRGADANRETLELIEHKMLTPEELAQARAAALALEASAYQVSKEVYDQTSPSQ